MDLSLSGLTHLPVIVDRPVTLDDLDLNRHMNVTRYFEAQTSSARTALARAGVDDRYVTERRMGTFAAEHHLRYLGELREGDRLTTRVRFVARSPKAVQLQSFLCEETSGRIACILEVIGVHVSQETRRPVEFPEDIAAELDALIAAGRQAARPTSLVLRGALGH